MSDRRALSKKIRFDVFKRDGFVCQYCGRHPPEVTLEVDHIRALAAGGVDEEGNLITSCTDCNRGKGARDLNVAPIPLGERAAIINERQAQLEGYNAIILAARSRLEDQAWEVVRAFNYGTIPGAFRRDWLLSIKRFVERLGLPETLGSMEIALTRLDPYVSDQDRFQYFCGVCWKKIKDRSE